MNLNLWATKKKLLPEFVYIVLSSGLGACSAREQELSLYHSHNLLLFNNLLFLLVSPFLTASTEYIYNFFCSS